MKSKMKKILLQLILPLLCCNLLAQKQMSLKSPDSKIRVDISVGDKINYDLYADDALLFNNNSLSLELKDVVLGEKPQVKKTSRKSINQNLSPVVPLKFSTVKDEFNQLVIEFKGNYVLEFRAYNEGIAYRFITKFKNNIEVLEENFDVNFPNNYKLHLQEPGSFKTAYEEPYSHKMASEWKKDDKMSVLPIIVEAGHHKILISESDLFDYPCMFLKGNGHGLNATFPKNPLEFGEDGDRSQKILKEANYIASTEGTRSFPWRYFNIVRYDGQLLENTLTYKLSTKSIIEDTSWIKPGQVSWEWWNEASPYGKDVNFVAGYNLETYKYFIDFAQKNGVEYIIMDEGWAKSTLDPYTPNPKVDVHEIIRYGKEKGVGVILWLTWLTVDRNMELFERFAEWGVAGVKIDFMDRSDQWMVNYYERVAKEAAKHHILVDFHGSFKPAGLEYKYPNVLSYEGVRGLEQMNGCHPDNTIYLPFMRNAVGPMDFTPGAMINMQPDRYSAQRPNSASMGTRVYQLALFVLFESGLQMLCDNPTMYYQNQECTDFITQVPVTWDETKVLQAELGQSVLVAKRKGEKWYLGGITNENERTIDLNFNFLPKNKGYTINYFEDGINANRQAMDYRKKETTIKSDDSMQIKMSRNGGWAAIIE